MNQTEFVDAIKSTILEGTANSIIKLLTSPPGRQPQEELLILSNWFNNLSVENKEMINRIIEESVEVSVFGLLCVLDGVRTIEDTFDKGVLKLYFEKNGISVLLNDPEMDFLHDLM